MFDTLNNTKFNASNDLILKFLEYGYKFQNNNASLVYNQFGYIIDNQIYLVNDKNDIDKKCVKPIEIHFDNIVCSVSRYKYNVAPLDNNDIDDYLNSFEM